MFCICPFFKPLYSKGTYFHTIGCCISTLLLSVVCKHQTRRFSPPSKVSITLRPAYSLLLALFPPVINTSLCPLPNSSSTKPQTAGRYPYRHGSECSSSINWFRLKRYSSTPLGLACASSQLGNG